MPRQITQLVNDEIYHVVFRAVGDAVVFNDEDDYYRGIFSIYEFNNKNFVTIREKRVLRNRFRGKIKTYRSPRPVSLNGLWVDERDKLVEILAFAFMPNHIHLLVRQLKDNGISQFMQKVGGGYANYFNKKYDRKGHLFNQFRAVLVKTNKQFKNVFVYIHANPISLIEPGWKEKGIENPDKVTEFLENYKWSSYQDYINKKNFPSVTEREFMLEVMDGEHGCKEEVESWIKYKKELKDLVDVILE
ncbi:MAG: transposase [Candidatus Staskawiczbacteria bacterium]|nr:transposase [Candidatus Staskawiczbacteria bacterium]